jgi:hypothetical protein
MIKSAWLSILMKQVAILSGNWGLEAMLEFRKRGVS